MKPKKTKIEVFLDDEAIAALESAANEQGTSRSGIARKMILDALKARKEAGREGK